MIGVTVFLFRAPHCRHCRGGIPLGGFNGTLNLGGSGWFYLGGGRRRLNFRCGGLVVAYRHTARARSYNFNNA
jgi:hypothetical protein